MLLDFCNYVTDTHGSLELSKTDLLCEDEDTLACLCLHWPASAEV